MKGADNMGKGGSSNTGNLKYQDKGSVGMRKSHSCGPMPRAVQTESGRGVKKLKSNIPSHNSKMDY